VGARLHVSRNSAAAAGEAALSLGPALAGPGGSGRAAAPARGSARALASPGGGACAALARLPAEPALAVVGGAGCQPLLPPPVQPESAPASLGGGAAGPPPPPGGESGPGSTSAGALAMRAVPRPQPKDGRLEPPARPAAGAAGGAVAADFMPGCAFGGLRQRGAPRQRAGTNVSQVPRCKTCLCLAAARQVVLTQGLAARAAMHARTSSQAGGHCGSTPPTGRVVCSACGRRAPGHERVVDLPRIRARGGVVGEAGLDELGDGGRALRRRDGLAQAAALGHLARRQLPDDDACGRAGLERVRCTSQRAVRVACHAHSPAREWSGGRLLHAERRSTPILLPPKA